MKFSKRDGVAICVMTDIFIDKIEAATKILFWLCTETECGSRLTSNIEKDTLLTHPNSHAHMPDYNCYQDLTLKTKFLSDFSLNPLESVGQSCEKVLAGNSDTSFSSFRNVKMTVYRQRYTMMPKIPRSIESLRIEKNRQKRRMEKKVFFYIDRGWTIVIFSREWQLKVISKSRIILSDGTLKPSPKFLTKLTLFLEYLENQKFPWFSVCFKIKRQEYIDECYK